MEESDVLYLTNQRRMNKFLLKILRIHRDENGSLNIIKGVTEQWPREDRKNQKK
jgi:hypothetical protein